jgi:hypothetical protein
VSGDIACSFILLGWLTGKLLSIYSRSAIRRREQKPEINGNWRLHGFTSSSTGRAWLQTPAVRVRIPGSELEPLNHEGTKHTKKTKEADMFTAIGIFFILALTVWALSHTQADPNDPRW